MKFFAGLKGINLDTDEAGSAEDRVREIKERVARRKSGMSKKQAEWDALGFDVTEE